MCLAQGLQRSDAGEARNRRPLGLESSTEPLRSLIKHNYLRDGSLRNKKNNFQLQTLIWGPGAYSKSLFLFFNPNIFCVYSKEQSY